MMGALQWKDMSGPGLVIVLLGLFLALFLIEVIRSVTSDKPASNQFLERWDPVIAGHWPPEVLFGFRGGGGIGFVFVLLRYTFGSLDARLIVPYFTFVPILAPLAAIAGAWIGGMYVSLYGFAIQSTNRDTYARCMQSLLFAGALLLFTLEKMAKWLWDPKRMQFTFFWVFALAIAFLFGLPYLRLHRRLANALTIVTALLAVIWIVTI